MTSSNTTWPVFLSPDRQTNLDGSGRRFGFEIEFGGLSLRQAVDVVTNTLVEKGLADEAEELTDYEWEVSTTVGPFRIERDASWLKDIARRDKEGQAISTLERVKESIGLPFARELMPVELVCPPLRFDQLGIVDDAIAALHAAGARGTDAQIHWAFGIHINAETWSIDADDITNVARAFAILQHHLFDHLEVDLARRLTPYITPYPDAYLDLLVDPAYFPKRDQLIDDYIRYNPTRGRALDLLVLLGHLDEDRVRGLLPAEKINCRPAFHYRLPNSNIGPQNRAESRWRASSELRAWALVEELANDSLLLSQALVDIQTQFETRVVRSPRPEDDACWLVQLHERVYGDQSLSPRAAVR